MDELLSNIAKFSPGNGVSGRVGGDCWGDNLASATNQLLMMQQAGASAQQLSRVIAEAAAAITAKMHGSGTAQDVMLRALLKDMGLALRDLSATVVGAIAARDQDPARTDGGCADAAASLDRTHSARFRRCHGESSCGVPRRLGRQGRIRFLMGRGGRPQGGVPCDWERHGSGARLQIRLAHALIPPDLRR